jgi:hypothetical protein
VVSRHSIADSGTDLDIRRAALIGAPSGADIQADALLRREIKIPGR